MRQTINAKLIYKLLALSGFSLCLWAVSARSKGYQEESFIPVTVLDQLPVRNGVVPVNLYCGQARLSSPNRIEEFHCSFKNSTNLNIIAANVIYSIVFEQNGSSQKDTSNQTVTALIHSDFRATSKLIAPGDETAVGPPGPITYGSDVVVKGVEISIDFVQFENNTTLGSDREGSRIVKAMRAGAEKYKGWLKRRYIQHAQSAAELATDLETDRSLPPELQTDPNEQLGAREYRRRCQQLLAAHGAVAIKKLLDSNQ